MCLFVARAVNYLIKFYRVLSSKQHLIFRFFVCYLLFPVKKLDVVHLFRASYKCFYLFSTVSTAITGMSSVTVQDFIKPWFKWSDPTYVWISRGNLSFVVDDILKILIPQRFEQQSQFRNIRYYQIGDTRYQVIVSVLPKLGWYRCRFDRKV